MATFTKAKLSGSTDGKPIKVTGTSTAATVTVHTAHASALDEIHIWAYNDDGQSRTLTIEYGGTTDPDDLIVVDVPPQAGLVYVVPGLILTNSLVVKAFASAANVVTVSGFINRIA